MAGFFGLLLEKDLSDLNTNLLRQGRHVTDEHTQRSWSCLRFSTLFKLVIVPQMLSRENTPVFLAKMRFPRRLVRIRRAAQ